MALITCHECGASISTDAQICPGCGAKTRAYGAAIQRHMLLEVLAPIVGLVALVLPIVLVIMIIWISSLFNQG